MSKSNVRDAAQRWARETRDILTVSLLLSEYFGTAAERESLGKALTPLWHWIAKVEGDDRVVPGPVSEPFDFICARELATILTPLFRLIVEPIPEFVELAAGLDERERKAITVPFGVVSGTMARHVCKHIWKQHADLAPEGWLL
ncbi:MAG: hypothetical protein KC657_24985 [Myxococcales bacterium]|nr:hypothetical protein [Myxococcales bacterium]